jgi:chromate transporter
VAVVFLRLGFTAFGGPAAHLALMEDEIVRRRGWIDRQHFLDLLAALNFIPGPNSTEMAISLGWIRAGYPGLVVAGTCFILPAMLIILPIAWVYVRFGTLPSVQAAMGGISAAVVAVVANAGIRFFKTGVTDRFTAGVATLSFVSEYLLRYGLKQHYPNLQAELIVLAAAAAAGTFWYMRPSRPPFIKAPMLSVLALLSPGTVPTVPVERRLSELARLALFFLKVGATLFGSGYVLATYLQAGLVEQYHWLSPQQLLDSIAVGQVTPGPLLTTATFIGFIRGSVIFGSVWGGLAGAVLATAAIFLPAFVFVAILGPLLPRLRKNRYVRGALNAMNAAVVALIFVVVARFAIGLWPSYLRIALAAASLIVLLRWNLNATWVLLCAGALGWAGLAAGIM